MNMSIERNLTNAELRRKTNKPIMEKRRRERINRCLEELKNIVLRAVNEESRPNKLEKADILEMTVRYLRTIRAQGNASQSHDIQNLNGSHLMREAHGPVKSEYCELVHRSRKRSASHRVSPYGIRPFDNARCHLPMPQPPFAHMGAGVPPPFAMSAKYPPIPVSPISSASSVSPRRVTAESPFEESGYGSYERSMEMKPFVCQYTPGSDHGSAAVPNSVSPYAPNLSPASSTSSCSDNTERWSPESSRDSSVDFPSDSYPESMKNSSFIWRPWGIAS